MKEDLCLCVHVCLPVTSYAKRGAKTSDVYCKLKLGTALPDLNDVSDS